MKCTHNALRRWLAGFCIAGGMALFATAGVAQTVSITNAWARATVAGQQAAGAYADVISNSPAALVAAESPAAASVELHSMSMDGGVMRMRRVERIELPAGTAVKLAPGGLHLMLFGIKQPLKAGDKLPLVLTVETPGGGRTVQKVDAEVRPLGAPAPSHH